MTDRFTPEQRSWNMSRIRSFDTKPEMLVRSLLHRIGFRFRIHCNNLPGRPDIVLPKYRTVIFIHGCFWHQHAGCIEASRPTSNSRYWNLKLEANIRRDRRHRRLLRQKGWRVMRFWECKVEKNPAGEVMRVARALRGNAAESTGYNLPSRRELLKAAQARAGYTKLK